MTRNQLISYHVRQARQFNRMAIVSKGNAAAIRCRDWHMRHARELRAAP